MTDVLTLKDLKPVDVPTACVIGHPIQHSKSPAIHNGWLKECGIEGHYHALDVAPEDLQEAVARLKECGYRGFNITIPHKQNVMKYCDEVKNAAQQIGATNTVYFKDNKTIADNTDAYGFITNLYDQTDKVSLKGKTALVIGAGGAARAIIYALIAEGISAIRITNRTFERTEALAQDFGHICQALLWEGRSLGIQDCDLIVNTTSLGMQGYPDLDLDLAQLKSDAIVADIVYTPLMTLLLKRAQGQGNAIVTGYGMLIFQAQRAFEHFFSVLPRV